jgi:hypothetical protein
MCARSVRVIFCTSREPFDLPLLPLCMRVLGQSAHVSVYLSWSPTVMRICMAAWSPAHVSSANTLTSVNMNGIMCLSVCLSVCPYTCLRISVSAVLRASLMWR